MCEVAYLRKPMNSATKTNRQQQLPGYCLQPFNQQKLLASYM